MGRRPVKWVYDFSEGSRDMRELLGGKGSVVAVDLPDRIVLVAESAKRLGLGK